MTPLEMIAEWRKGCTIAGPMHSKCYPDGEPMKTGYCVECTEALIDALESVLKEPNEGMLNAGMERADQDSFGVAVGPIWLAMAGAPAPERAKDCPSSPDGRHQVDTSMESGPNNCFHCDAPMGKPSPCPDLDPERGRGLA